MAFALRRLLRSCSKNYKDREKRPNCEGSKDSPRQAARRLIARACSSVQNYRDRVSPAESSPVQHVQQQVKLAEQAAVTPSSNTTSTAASKKKTEVKINDSQAHHTHLVRSRRLMKELQEVTKSQKDSSNPIFSVELVEDNLYEWNVKLHVVDSESLLYRDMVEANVRHILLNISFPENFPFAPPFMRVIAPRIEKGFVMEGGAICMELLTPRGWASAYTVEAVIMQFSASLVKGQARIARKTKGSKDFSKKSAEASFRSLVKTHEKYGWVTPPLADG